MTPEFMQELRDIKKDLGEIRMSQTLHNEQLKEHIRRSLASEQNLELLRKEFEPVKLHTVLWATLAKVIITLAGLVAAYWKIFH
jgi:hypothetical protein